MKNSVDGVTSLIEDLRNIGENPQEMPGGYWEVTRKSGSHAHITPNKSGLEISVTIKSNGTDNSADCTGSFSWNGELELWSGRGLTGSVNFEGSARQLAEEIKKCLDDCKLLNKQSVKSNDKLSN